MDTNVQYWDAFEQDTVVLDAMVQSPTMDGISLKSQEGCNRPSNHAISVHGNSSQGFAPPVMLNTFDGTMYPKIEEQRDFSEWKHKGRQPMACCVYEAVLIYNLSCDASAALFRMNFLSSNKTWKTEVSICQ